MVARIDTNRGRIRRIQGDRTVLDRDILTSVNRDGASCLDHRVAPLHLGGGVRVGCTLRQVDPVEGEVVATGDLDDPVRGGVRPNTRGDQRIGSRA